MQCLWDFNGQRREMKLRNKQNGNEYVHKMPMDKMKYNWNLLVYLQFCVCVYSFLHCNTKREKSSAITKGVWQSEKEKRENYETQTYTRQTQAKKNFMHKILCI